MTFLNAFRDIISHLSIARKISYGYCIAIGIGTLGTIAGLVLGDFYQQKALSKLAAAYQQQEAITELENSLKTMQFHPQLLVKVLGETIAFDYEKSKFFDNLSQIKRQIDQLQAFVDQGSEIAVLSVEDIQHLSESYQTTIEEYVGFIETIWQDIDPPSLSQQQIPNAQQEIWNTFRNESALQISREFERLSEDLIRLTAKSKVKQAEADQQFQTAEALRLKIIAGSIILSTILATILALTTSQAIARPIQQVTKIAEQVTQEANFSLKVPIASRDEVGSLSNSLNQLIQWTGQYTHELEVSRQTLEERVIERTQELRQALNDLQATQTQLIQTEKMSGLGQMVAGIAHEINNPVGFIHGNIDHVNGYIEDLLGLIELYQTEYSQPTSAIIERTEAIELDFIQEDLPQILHSIKTGTERIRAIVLSLRNFSRLDEADCKSVDLNEGLDSTLLILNHQLKQNIEVIKDYGELSLVECYPAQLNQVFMSILVNATDALEESVRENYLDEQKPKFQPQIIICTRQLNLQQVQVSIRDNGPGIPTEIHSKLFDPFFTTKDVGKGTGLGLSVSYQIIEKHNGTIQVNSPADLELKQGAEFLITLPIVQPRANL